ncbi:MAG: hypothetical protein CL867_12200 [Cytophagaceae bacterium]|nr:hypothetical protein [Cytophagaceae bacterium]
MNNYSTYYKAMLLCGSLAFFTISNAQVGINTTSPTKQLDIDVSGMSSEGLNIRNTNFNLQLLTTNTPNPFTAILNNDNTNGLVDFRFDNDSRYIFSSNVLFPGVNATDNTVAGGLDIGRFDLHFRRVYSRGIHTNDNGVNGGLRINIGSSGGVTADYNFSNFAFYPVASQVKDLGRNGNFWRNFYFVSAFTPSDRRLKKDIKTLSKGLETILALKTYEYGYTFDEKEIRHYGFMAQELQKQLPNLVAVGDDEQQSLSINYTEVIPILIKAVQEQQVLIEQQATAIKALQQQVTD